MSLRRKGVWPVTVTQGPQRYQKQRQEVGADNVGGESVLKGTEGWKVLETGQRWLGV